MSNEADFTAYGHAQHAEAVRARVPNGIHMSAHHDPLQVAVIAEAQARATDARPVTHGEIMPILRDMAASIEALKTMLERR